MSIANVLVGKGSEIFATSSGLMVCLNRQIKPIDSGALTKLRAFASDKIHAYKAMVGGNEADQLTQCAKCMFSSLDGVPDIDQQGNIIPEVVECEKRGVCKWEGIGCLPKPTSALTPAQQRVAALCTYPAKIIADKLCLSMFTVKRHLQDVKRIMGAKNIAELVKLLN